MTLQDGQMTKKHEVALIELLALGLIEFKDDELFCITDKGIDRAKEIMNKFPLPDQILVMIATTEIVKDSPLEEEGGGNGDDLDG